MSSTAIKTMTQKAILMEENPSIAFNQFKVQKYGNSHIATGQQNRKATNSNGEEPLSRKIHLIAAARPNFMKIAPLFHAFLVFLRDLL